VGDFEAVNVNGRIKKNGGNVASYFCTPEGRVIHAVVGPVGSEELLREAKWATKAYESVKDSDDLTLQMQHMSQAHLAMSGNGWSPSADQPHGWRHGGSRTQRIHRLLAVKPLAPIADVYEEIFGHILGQKVSKAAPNLALADRQLSLAEQSGRPLLFVIHREHDNSKGYSRWLKHVATTELRGVPLKALVQEHVVVVLPLKELPALSHRLDRPPFAAPDRGTPLFVLARSDGEQTGVVTGWHSQQYLMNGLASSMIEYLAKQQNSLVRLRRVQRLLGKLDRSYIEAVKPLIIRETERRKAERQEELASATHSDA